MDAQNIDSDTHEHHAEATVASADVETTTFDGSYAGIDFSTNERDDERALFEENNSHSKEIYHQSAEFDDEGALFKNETTLEESALPSEAADDGAEVSDQYYSNQVYLDQTTEAQDESVLFEPNQEAVILNDAMVSEALAIVSSDPQSTTAKPAAKAPRPPSRQRRRKSSQASGARITISDESYARHKLVREQRQISAVYLPKLRSDSPALRKRVCAAIRVSKLKIPPLD